MLGWERLGKETLSTCTEYPPFDYSQGVLPLPSFIPVAARKMATDAMQYVGHRVLLQTRNNQRLTGFIQSVNMKNNLFTLQGGKLLNEIAPCVSEK